MRQHTKIDGLVILSKGTIRSIMLATVIGIALAMVLIVQLSK